MRESGTCCSVCEQLSGDDPRLVVGLLGAICERCLRVWLGIVSGSRWCGSFARGRCDFCNDRSHAKEILRIKGFPICLDCMRVAYDVLRERGLVNEEFPDLPRGPEFDPEIEAKALRKQQASFQEVAKRLVSLLARMRNLEADGKEEISRFAEEAVVKLARDLIPGLGYDDYDGREQLLREVVDRVDQIIRGAEAEAGGGFFSEIWGNKTFMELADVAAVFNRAKDLTGMRFRRILRLYDSEDTLKRLLGTEEDYKKFKLWVAEREEEISMFFKGVRDKPAETILSRLANEPAYPESVIASLRALAALGELDWRERRIWNAFHRAQERVLFDEEVTVNDPRVWDDELQSQIGRQLVLEPGKEQIVRFEEGDALDTVRLETKVQQALDLLWPPEEMRDLRDENARQIRRQRDAFIEEALERSTCLPQWLGLILLESWHGGWRPALRYETYLVQYLGRSGTTPDLAFAFVALGTFFGLLDEDALARLRTAGGFPPREWMREDHAKRRTMAELATALREGRVPFLFLDAYLTDQAPA